MALKASVMLLVLTATATHCCTKFQIQSYNCGYNSTKYGGSSTYPNPVVDNLGNAFVHLDSLEAILDTGCSRTTEQFGCSALLPNCADGLGPCRSLCETFLQDCAQEIIQHQQTVLVLQDMFNCSRYPTSNCIAPSPVEPTPTTSASAPGATITPSATITYIPLNTSSCPPPSMTYYTDAAKSFAKGWIATWSTLCFLSTLVTILTFAINPTRFQYPWKPIVYLAISFNLHSCGYLLSLMLGRSIVTCPNEEYLTTSSEFQVSHMGCLLVFVLLYYSMMASFLWWLFLTLSWFLSSALKWSNEAVGRLATMYHIIAWILPVIMTISLVAGRVISADELTGICFVVRSTDSSSLYALLIGVIIPQMVFLIIGMGFLVLGLIGVCRIRTFLRHKGQEKESMIIEKLIIRVGIFVSMFVIPAVVVIGCFFYELIDQPKWVTIEESENCSDCATANSAVFILRIFLFFLIGILTGVWIWSKKTIDSWKTLGNRCYKCRRLSSPVAMHPRQPSGSSVFMQPSIYNSGTCTNGNATML